MSQTGLSPSSSSIPLSAAENYQLKWNSHVTNLNTSISSLLKNDKYADVMLLTCNADEGFCGEGIPAHKLILGTCSHVSQSKFYAPEFDVRHQQSFFVIVCSTSRPFLITTLCP